MVVHYPSEPPTPAQTPARKYLWSGADLVLGVLFVMAALGVVIAVAVIVIETLDLDESDDSVTVFTSLALEALIGGVVLLMMRLRGVTFAQIGFVRPRRWGPLVTAWIGAYLILIAYGALLELLDSFGVDTSLFDGGNDVPLDGDISWPLLWLLGVAVVVMAPLNEELFFRGLLFTGLRERWPLLPAIALSGLLFGAFHFNLSVLLPFALIGALFAWAKAESGSIWISIGAHAGVNTVSFIAAQFVSS